jgi:hypothetical protein
MHCCALIDDAREYLPGVDGTQTTATQGRSTVEPDLTHGRGAVRRDHRTRISCVAAAMTA